MRFYLSSPMNRLQAAAANGSPVLLSFASAGGSRWHDEYLPSYDRVLLDSGAYSELTTGVRIDLDRYVDWVQKFPWVDAWAGLDDITGDWHRSLQNYEKGGFPTIHDTDPIALLNDLIPMARERGGWIGVGLKPPRERKEGVVRDLLDRMPHDLHVHGWALGRYAHLGRLDSVDSTNWFRDAWKLRTMPALHHLTEAETLEIVVKRYQRRDRIPEQPSDQVGIWDRL